MDAYIQRIDKAISDLAVAKLMGEKHGMVALRAALGHITEVQASIAETPIGITAATSLESAKLHTMMAMQAIAQTSGEPA